MLEIETLINVLTLGAAFMLGLLLFSAHLKNRAGNIFLGLFLWNLAYLKLTEIGEDQLIENFEFLFDGTMFILVFLFLYLITTINRPFKKWYLLLFLPGIIMNLIIFMNPAINENNTFHYIDLFRIFYVLDLILIVYFFRILRNHSIMVNNFYSNMELKTLSWLKTLVFLVLFLHFTWIIESVIPIDNEIFDHIFNIISSVIMFVMVYWIGFNGFSQPEIFKGGFFYAMIDEGKKEQNEPNLEITQKEYLFLKEKIIKDRLYAKQNLTLRDLAIGLKMKEKNISTLIKLHSGTTFYHFINGFRIEEFKKTMNSSKSTQLSIFGLAQEVGFASKSTFYSAFKAVEAMTPKQYESTLKEFD